MSVSKKDRRWSTLVPRGFLKACLLDLLSKGPLHGYALMHEIQISTGFWKPSPGTIYPLLKSLEKEGCIRFTLDPSRRKTYQLTLKGKKLAKDAENLRADMRKRMSRYLMKLHPESETALSDFFGKSTQNCRRRVLYPVHITLSLLLDLSAYPEKTPAACLIMDEANQKLQNLLSSHRGGSR
ncbi:MAG: PadR family transcriptional regulator [Candidatus Aenigmarchaeota archaeon]|nr:PadR family transcriptional regulator [Candidatus Aenigmarchaeota archaeon]